MKLTKLALLILLCAGLAHAQHSVNLTWVAPTGTVTGYNVYRGSTSGGPYAAVNQAPVPALSYSDTTVLSGSTDYYVVTALNSAGESLKSTEVSAAIPADTAPGTIVPPANPATFTPAAGTRVGLLTANNVRATPAVSGTLRGVAPAGTLGTVTTVAPVDSKQGWIYVNVKFDNCTNWGTKAMIAAGCIGWTGADSLGTVTGQAPPPPTPTPSVSVSGDVITLFPTNVPVGSGYSGTVNFVVNGVTYSVPFSGITK